MHFVYCNFDKIVPLALSTCVLQPAPPGAPGSCCESLLLKLVSLQLLLAVAAPVATTPLLRENHFRDNVLGSGLSCQPLPPPEPALRGLLHRQPART